MTSKLDASDVEFIHPKKPASKDGGERVRLTLDQIDYPSYLVNSRFELVWANDQAQAQILGADDELSSDITERNLFTLFLRSGMVTQAEGRDDILRFHLSIAKNRVSKAALLGLDLAAGEGDAENLVRLYDAVEPAGRKQILHTEVNLAKRGSPDQWHTLYASFFREGIFFAYAPAGDSSETLLQLLARRDIVIRDFVKKRRPYLTPLAVVVADIQDSMKICAELPAEEYFELINDVWGAMEPLLRKYYATHGKHVGDGVVYYFFPQPDCSYVMNAIRCAQEMKDTMREISRTWRNRKNWTNELRFNIGLDEGQEWFGTYQTATHIEFTVLGDTINTAGRLSDFARSGAVWVTKSMLGKLSSKERAGVHFGVRRTGEDGAEIIVPTTYSRITNLVDLENPRYEKFHDIGVLPVTEILDVEPRKS
ncbi:MAG: adenylate/guanylate cyclase domain-containing protein [Proteobacteria bacterium]|nr:adenylate/guanylate cyclase domain-containing protein [Pseudomonadota bacterium]